MNPNIKCTCPFGNPSIAIAKDCPVHGEPTAFAIPKDNDMNKNTFNQEAEQLIDKMLKEANLDNDMSKEDGTYFNKLMRKKILWVEIKAKEQEYQRLQKQIDELVKAQKDVSFDIQKRIDESQKIADFLLEKEYEALKANNI